MTMKIKIILGTFAIIAGLAAGIYFFRPHTFHGTVIQSPEPSYDFTLTGANGDVSLSDYRGKLVLIYFGYTFCPDICPATLANVGQSLRELGKKADHVQLIMVSLDPERDTPEKMKAYVAHFDPNFIGVSGNLADLEAIWEELGVFVEKEDTGSAAGYLVSHTSSVYVLDRNGNLILMFPYGTSAVDIASDLSELLKQTKQ